MTVPQFVAGFVSMPVAIIGTAGTVLALTFDPTIAAAGAVTVIVALTAGIVAILTKLGDTKIKLAEISRSVDGMASRTADEVNALKDTITWLRAQLAEEKSTASTLAATHAAVAVAKVSGTQEKL